MFCDDSVLWRESCFSWSCCLICFSAICLFSYLKKKGIDVKNTALFE